MKKFIALFTLLTSFTLPTLAQSAADTPRPQVNGEVRKVDLDADKLTIRHADIPNLGMPGMTMVFRVASPALLNQLKSGDQVQFTAERIDGALTVMSIVPR